MITTTNKTKKMIRELYFKLDYNQKQKFIKTVAKKLLISETSVLSNYVSRENKSTAKNKVVVKVLERLLKI